MYLYIEPALFERFPQMRVVVAVAHGIDNQRERTELTTCWHTTWTHAANQARSYGNAQSHPYVQPWREQFRAMGISSKKFPSAIEALLRRVLKEDGTACGVSNSGRRGATPKVHTETWSDLRLPRPALRTILLPMTLQVSSNPARGMVGWVQASKLCFGSFQGLAGKYLQASG